MARYINKDEFIAQIQDNFCTECNNYDGVKCKSCGIDDTIEMVENADETDVVPKSEVEKIFEEFKSTIRSEITRNEQLFAEEEDDFYDGRNDAFRTAINLLAELKKKYTEGE